MVKRRKTTKQSHHLWQSNATRDGDVIVNRTKAEREDLDDLELYQAKAAASLGMWGASMTDLRQFSRLPHNASKHYSKVAKELQDAGETAPKVMSWAKLSKAFGADKVASVKESVEFGMKARLASKELNIPFVMAADLVEDWEKVGTAVLKEIVDTVKEGKTSSAPKALVKKVRQVLSSSIPKIAIDQAAAEYYKAYYGPFGESLVKEVKKRVKADLVKLWMVKQGVDEAAAEYWSAYYSDTGYGADMTKDVKDRKKAQSKKAQEDWETQEYQGWTNYATWAVALWINNEYEIYKQVQGVAAEGDVQSLAEYIKSLSEDNFGVLEAFSDAINEESISAVNWQEVAQDFLTE
jgi:hypothetical protein